MISRPSRLSGSLLQTITDTDSDTIAIAIDWPEDWTLTIFARFSCISQTNDGDPRPPLSWSPIASPSPGASTECATKIPNLSPDSMWSYNNLLDKSHPQLYKRSGVVYVECKQRLLTGCFEGGRVGRD
ncbi:hypothetical protein N7445_003699 [Penicillium cf. griseofulvum]|nr:hypothetical protein N7445_003699 [Penicillium cf. griseofulvum]